MVKPNYSLRASYKLDYNLLEELKISNGECQWGEEVKKLIDNNISTSFKV